MTTPTKKPFDAPWNLPEPEHTIAILKGQIADIVKLLQIYEERK